MVDIKNHKIGRVIIRIEDYTIIKLCMYTILFNTLLANVPQLDPIAETHDQLLLKKG